MSRARQVASRARATTRRSAKRALAAGWTPLLRARNRRSSRSVLGDAPVAVSLTSFGARVADVALTVESIAAGTRRPQRLVLWLDDPRLFDERPESLLRLERRGLEVRLSDNYGPHTKYFPYVSEREHHEVPLVTADDDLLYPPWWLDRLLAAHRAMPEVVHCYRANVVTLRDDGLAPYNQWPRCRDTVPGLTRFATGVAGVIYPPAMLDALAARGDAFRAVCPRADDVWLHWVALRTGTLVRQVAATPRHWPVVAGSQKVGLVQTNVHAGGNDEQIRATYDDSDVRLLRAAALEAAPSPRRP